MGCESFRGELRSLATTTEATTTGGGLVDRRRTHSVSIYNTLKKGIQNRSDQNFRLQRVAAHDPTREDTELTRQTLYGSRFEPYNRLRNQVVIPCLGICNLRFGFRQLRLTNLYDGAQPQLVARLGKVEP